MTSSLLPVPLGASPQNSLQLSPGCRTILWSWSQAHSVQGEKAAPRLSVPASLMLPPIAGSTSRQKGWGDLNRSPLHCTADSRDNKSSKVARTAALLIRVVPTVVVVVALPATWHAAVVLAAELVGLTGAFIWEG